jgi:hypothetical protein
MQTITVKGHRNSFFIFYSNFNYSKRVTFVTIRGIAENSIGEFLKGFFRERVMYLLMCVPSKVKIGDPKVCVRIITSDSGPIEYSA